MVIIFSQPLFLVQPMTAFLLLGGDFRAGMFHHGFPAEFSVISFSS